jgi:hypothetical protein
MQIQKTWQKFTLLNVGMVLGLFASLFVIPRNTAIWILVVLFSAIVGTMNYLLFMRLRKTAGGKSAKDTGLSSVILFVGFLIFVLDFLLRLVGHSR